MNKDHSTVILLRALVKLSSAIYDMDELRESDKLRFSFKKDLPAFQDWIENYIKGPVNNLTKADDVMLMDFINMFNSYEETVFIKDEFQTRVNLLLAKCHSVMYDLSQLDSVHSSYVIELSAKINTLLNKGYLKPYIDYVDPEGKSFQDIVSMMNKDGDLIIVAGS